ncbi:MAG: LysR family transcriptional regulator [Paracoccaceae bacterium]
MGRLSEMEAFIAVVDQGGFTDAARRLNLSKSAVSKHVAALEERLAVRLLNRTTRRVNPTEIGLAYYDRAIAVLKDANEADEMVTAMQSDPRGLLRISAPVSFGLRHLMPVITEFLAAYPDVSVNVVFEDRFTELVAEGYDAALRIGVLEDSSLKMRKLARATMLLLAAPDYLQKHGTPRSIDDLSKHTLLHYSLMAAGNVWRLTSPSGEERQVRVGGRLTANNGDALLQATERGLGIAFAPSFMACEALKSGRLMQILPELPARDIGVHIVYPEGRYLQPKLRVLIDFLAEHFKGRGPIDW